MTKELVANRRARHDYEILETLEAGLILQGTEIKSLREGGGSLQEAYIRLLHGEPWLIGSHIAPYRYGNIHNHEAVRDRKLLLHKREIAKLKEAIQEKGLTLVPLSLYLKKGRVKVLLAKARGKKSVDKRHALKERDETRRVQRALRQHG